MNFDLAEDQLAIQHAIRDFAKTEIAPNVMVYETNQAFPAELLQDLGDLGIMGITMPESLGGAGPGYIEYALIVEELSAVDPALGLTVAAHNSLESETTAMVRNTFSRS